MQKRKTGKAICTSVTQLKCTSRSHVYMSCLLEENTFSGRILNTKSVTCCTKNEHITTLR